MPDVSVIIPVFNRAGLVTRAVSSALRQTVSPLEDIVVDDGSTDGSAEVLSKLNDLRLRVLRHDVNRGAAAARNTGLRAARGDFVAYLDSDDEWLPEKLGLQLELFKSGHGRLGMVGCWYRNFWPDGRTEVREYWTKGDIYKSLFGRPAQRPVVFTGALLVRHVPGKPVAIWDESLPSWDDWDYMVQVSKSWEFEFVPAPLVNRYVQTGPRVHHWTHHHAAADVIDRKYRAEIIELTGSPHFFKPWGVTFPTVRHNWRAATGVSSGGGCQGCR
jgi:glycosyltransferase involved in cell wall biosynthesis